MNKKGFTLVELLAVIVILAIILVIAIPAIFNVIDDARKGSIESSAKLIAKNIMTDSLAKQVIGGTYIVADADCMAIGNLAAADYASCEYTVAENATGGLTVKVTIIGAGKLAKWKVVDATPTSATAAANS